MLDADPSDFMDLAAAIEKIHWGQICEMIAREKADERGIEVEFAAADALQLERFGRMFETVLDCGVFHTFDGDERTQYVASLASVTEHDGTLYVLCFSDDGPETGPHPIRQEDLRAAFSHSNG